MTAESAARAFVSLLARVRSGRAEAELDRAPLVTLDGDAKDLVVQIGPLWETTHRGSSLLRETPVRLWEARGVPSALARSGWRVSFRDGPQEMIRLGRDVSALSGHVHVSPAALWKLRRLV